jgi:hypothetical protein
MNATRIHSVSRLIKIGAGTIGGACVYIGSLLLLFSLLIGWPRFAKAIAHLLPLPQQSNPAMVSFVLIAATLPPILLAALATAGFLRVLFRKRLWLYGTAAAGLAVLASAWVLDVARGSASLDTFVLADGLMALVALPVVCFFIESRKAAK